MLSRVANAVYWSSRYLERAENVCRFIHVSLHYMMDAEVSDQNFWYSLVSTSGDEDNFHKTHSIANKENILRFLILDQKNPNSITSCIKLARENARTVREIISSKMWQEINSLYWLTVNISKKRKLDQELDVFLNNFQTVYMCFLGAVELGMNRNEAWHFMRIGRLLERADKTGRILDVKYFQMQESRKSEEETKLYGLVISKSLLKSASALEMFRKEYSQISSIAVVEFLLTNKQFPRSIKYCVDKIRTSLNTIISINNNHKSSKIEDKISNLLSEINQQQKRVLSGDPIHHFIDLLQRELNQLDTMLYHLFFSNQRGVHNSYNLNQS